MKILVTGSRTWDDPIGIEYALVAHTPLMSKEDVVIIHGACPDGADQIADDIAQKYGWTVQRWPADWEQYGKRAGFVRNAQMVDQNPDICLAFIRDESKGATMTFNMAVKKGIETWLYDYHGRNSCYNTT